MHHSLDHQKTEMPKLTSGKDQHFLIKRSKRLHKFHRKLREVDDHSRHSFSSKFLTDRHEIQMERERYAEQMDDQSFESETHDIWVDGPPVVMNEQVIRKMIEEDKLINNIDSIIKGLASSFFHEEQSDDPQWQRPTASCLDFGDIDYERILKEYKYLLNRSNTTMVASAGSSYLQCSKTPANTTFTTGNILHDRQAQLPSKKHSPPRQEIIKIRGRQSEGRQIQPTIFRTASQEKIQEDRGLNRFGRDPSPINKNSDHRVRDMSPRLAQLKKYSQRIMKDKRHLHPDEQRNPHFQEEEYTPQASSSSNNTSSQGRRHHEIVYVQSVKRAMPHQPSDEVYVVRQPARKAPYRYHYTKPEEHHEEEYLDDQGYVFYEEQRPGYVYEYPEQPLYRPNAQTPVYRHTATGSCMTPTPVYNHRYQPISGQITRHEEDPQHDRSNRHKMVKKKAIMLINEKMEPRERQGTRGYMSPRNH